MSAAESKLFFDVVQNMFLHKGKVPDSQMRRWMEVAENLDFGGVELSNHELRQGHFNGLKLYASHLKSEEEVQLISPGVDDIAS